MELTQFWAEIKEDGIQSAVLSSPVKGSELEKVQIRPVIIKDKELWQIAEYRNHQDNQSAPSHTLQTLFSHP